MYSVYGDIQSGNCYKVKLVMELLKIPHQWIAVDILAGETRNDAFRSLNPNMKIPLLVLDDQRVLAESNAILNYLAENSHLLPTERYLHAQVLQWQFFEQYSHEPYIATARFINKYLGLPAQRKTEYEAKQVGGHRALHVMETCLQEQDYLVGKALTIADISLYAYTHVAHEGGFDLDGYPAIRRWLTRLAGTPGFRSMAQFAG